jgi:hypothetical protein
LVGVACEAIGDTALSKLVPNLKSEEARRVITELEKIDGTGVTWDEALRNENRLAQYERRNGFSPFTWAVTRDTQPR